MKAEIAKATKGNLGQSQTTNLHLPRPTISAHIYIDLAWQALANSQISMPLHNVHNLLPRFKATVHSLTNSQNLIHRSVNLTTLTSRLPLMNSQNPTVQLLIRSHEIPGCIIDGGSGVNVISKATCKLMVLLSQQTKPFRRSLRKW